MESTWRYIGMIKDRVRVYQGKSGAYAVNRDDDMLYFPTDEELDDIRLTYGSRELQVAGEKVSLQAVTAEGREVAALNATITALRLEALEMEKEIEALRAALKKRTRI